MDKYVILVLTTICSVLASPPRISKHYRSDYEYNHKTDAFYKFHTESRGGLDVNETCRIEGATLMLVESEEDTIQAHGMFKKYPELSELAWVASDGRQHESAEEKYEYYYDESSDEYRNSNDRGNCDVISRKGDIVSYDCNQKVPFFCKVKANDAPYDSRCKVYGTDYVYVPSVGSCYRISKDAYSWNEAYAECRAEGSHLLVLNSLAEGDAIRNLARYKTVKGSRVTYIFFAGFRASPPQGNEPLVFKTIFNQTLEEAGFSTWHSYEPNNVNGNEFCGAFCECSGLYDVNCADLYGFICEKEVQTPSP